MRAEEARAPPCEHLAILEGAPGIGETSLGLSFAPHLVDTRSLSALDLTPWFMRL